MQPTAAAIDEPLRLMRSVSHSLGLNQTPMIPIDLRSARLRIRRANPQDAGHSYAWFANASVTRFLPLAGKSALPLESIEAFLTQAATSDRPELAVTIEAPTRGPIGCGGFRNFDGQSAEVSLVIGEPALWGQGLGQEALGLLLDFGFTDLGLTTIWLIVRTDNAAAVSLFQRNGFAVVEHRRAASTIDGIPIDKFKMQLSQRDYERHSRSKAMHIRLAVADDANAIATIHVRAWQVAYRGLLPSSFLDSLSISRREEFWRQQLQRNEAPTLLAEAPGRALGWAQVGPSRDADASRGTGELYAMYVAPQHWRQGIGHALWTEGVAHLRRTAFRDATLWVLRENASACAFYRAVGFVPDVGIEKTLQVAGAALSEIRLRYTLDG